MLRDDAVRYIYITRNPSVLSAELIKHIDSFDRGNLIYLHPLLSAGANFLTHTADPGSEIFTLYSLTSFPHIFMQR